MRQLLAMLAHHLILTYKRETREPAVADPDKTSTPPAEQPAKTRKTAPKIKHLDGCPADPDRVEQYDTERHNQDHSLTVFQVTRCQDCGAHEAKQK